MTVVLGTLPSEALRSDYIQGHTCQLKRNGERDRNVCTSGDMEWAGSRYEAKPIYIGRTSSDNMKTCRGDDRSPLVQCYSAHYREFQLKIDLHR